MTEQTAEPKATEKQVSDFLDILGGPYYFETNEGTRFEIREFDMRSELWAEKTYGSVEEFFNGIVGKKPKTAYAIAGVINSLTDSSMAMLVGKKKEGETLEDTLVRLVPSRSGFYVAVKMLVGSIIDGMPDEDMKKKLFEAVAQNRTKRDAMQKAAE